MVATAVRPHEVPVGRRGDDIDRPGDDIDRTGRRTRARRLALAVAVAGVLVCLGAAVAIVAGGSDGDVDHGEVPRLAVDTDLVAISFGGDTLLGDAAQPLIETNGASWVLDRLDPVHPDDVFLVNLEGPVSTLTEPFDPDKRWSYNAQPETADALAAFGVDGFILANNHAVDRGPDGLDDTRFEAERTGIVTFGAGADLHEARLPLLVESPGGTVAVAAFSDNGGVIVAEDGRAGIRGATPRDFAADHALARELGADMVIASIHWGENYAPVDDRQRSLARALVDVGYDAVVGHGPHIVQPMEVIDGVPVFYSIGNWVFGTPGRFRADAPGQGVVLRVVADPAEPRKAAFELRCIETNNEGVAAFQPHACSADTAAVVLGAVAPDIVIDGSIGRLG